jgi:hypothetical protein
MMSEKRFRVGTYDGVYSRTLSPVSSETHLGQLPIAWRRLPARVLPSAGRLRSQALRENPYSLSLVLALLFAANVFDTGGALGVKYVSYAVACVYAIFTPRRARISFREMGAGIILFAAWPAWALLVGIFHGRNLRLAISQVTPFPAALLVALLVSAVVSRVPIRIFFNTLLAMAVATLALFWTAYLLPGNPVTERIITYFSDYGYAFGFFGIKPGWAIVVPNVYFGPTLFLVPAFAYFLFTRKTLRAILCVLALGVAFSRAGVLASVLLAACYALGSSASRTTTTGAEEKGPKDRHLRRKIVSLVLAIVALLAIGREFPPFRTDLSDLFSHDSSDITVRISYLRSSLSLFGRHPTYLLLGQGAGIYDFTPWEIAAFHNPEFDHIATAQKFGLPWLLAFTLFIFYTGVKLIRRGDPELRAAGIGLLAMYFVGGTNPLLLSPLYLMFAMLCYFLGKNCLARQNQHSPVNI